MDSISNVLQLSAFTFNKICFNYTAIRAFQKSAKKENDANNKIRESIVAAIINQVVPDNYFILASWLNLRTSIFNFIRSLRDSTVLDSNCTIMAGRNHNFDFLLRVFYEDGPIDYNVELKFNAASVDDAPQFVSPMKPSQYLNRSYEEFYYDNYIQKLSNISGFEVPSKEDFLRHIHSPKPKCMKSFQDLYYRGCSRSSQYSGVEGDVEFYKLANLFSQESIERFIQDTDLNASLLSDYLATSQKGKVYMLYSGDVFVAQTVHPDDYAIVSVIKTHNSYVCSTRSGKKMTVLLRWKNGNGIAFPAFQIS